METRRLAIAWVTAWFALTVLAAAIIGPWTNFYGSMGVELPWITSVVVSAGEVLRGPVGWLVLVALLALGLLPLHLGVGGDDHRRWLLLGIAQAALAALLLWAALELPLVAFSRTLTVDGPPSPEPPLALRDVVARSALFTAPGLLIVTFLQVAAWLPIAVRVHRLPRERLQDEAERAVVVAALPAAALAIGASWLVDELRTGPSTGLVVAPSLAAAGTAALITYGVALWLRMRGASGEA